MADEHIRREDLINHLAICKKGTDIPNLAWAAITAIECYVRDMPAADVAPVRHGHWVKYEFFSDEVNNGEKCSQCGELIGWFGNLPKYCPGCGALMDGGKDNG